MGGEERDARGCERAESPRPSRGSRARLRAYRLPRPVGARPAGGRCRRGQRDSTGAGRGRRGTRPQSRGPPIADTGWPEPCAGVRCPAARGAAAELPGPPAGPGGGRSRSRCASVSAGPDRNVVEDGGRKGPCKMTHLCCSGERARKGATSKAESGVWYGMSGVRKLRGEGGPTSSPKPHPQTRQKSKSCHEEQPEQILHQRSQYRTPAAGWLI